jgi:hypothetical protein
VVVTARSLTPNHKLVTVSLDAAAGSFPFDTPAVCMARANPNPDLGRFFYKPILAAVAKHTTERKSRRHSKNNTLYYASRNTTHDQESIKSCCQNTKNGMTTLPPKTNGKKERPCRSQQQLLHECDKFRVWQQRASEQASSDPICRKIIIINNNNA